MRRRPRPRPRSAPRAARAPSRSRGIPVSAPPASPSVTMQYVTSMPASVTRGDGCRRTRSRRRRGGRSPRGCARRRRASSGSMSRMARRYRLVTDSPFEARELVGLLADDDRRRVFAALVLGATDDRARSSADTGLDARGRAAGACNASSTPGSCVRGDDGTLPPARGGVRARGARRSRARAAVSRSTTTSPRTWRRCCACSCATAGSRRSRRPSPSASWCSTGSRSASSPAGATPENMVNLILAAGASRHRGAAALPRRRRHPRSGARRVLAYRRHVRP